MELQDLKIIADLPQRLFGYGIILHFFLITLKKKSQAGQLVHAYNAIVEAVEAEESGVHDHSLGYIANSKSAWTICDPATNDSQKLHRSFLILGKV